MVFTRFTLQPIISSMHMQSWARRLVWRVLVVLGIVRFTEKAFFNTGRIARSKHGGLPVRNAQEVDQSYVLLAPFNTNDHKGAEGQVRLLDLYGVTLHRWHTTFQTSSAQLLPNGELIVSLLEPDTRISSELPNSSHTGILQKLNWAGTVVWEYKHPKMHNCFEIMPNGHVLITVWEEVPNEMRKELLNSAHTLGREHIWSDVILEIDAKGEVVWQWHAMEHLEHSKHSLKEFVHRVEWTHINGVHYIEENPFDGTEALLLSMRNLDRIYMVSKKTNRVLWMSPEGMFAGQHDPTYTPRGTVLAFDNGLHRRPRSRSEVVYSRVLEVDPLTDKIVWSIEGGTTSHEKVQLYEPLMCGVRRLKNGNTQVVLSCNGHVFELTPDKKVVWDFVSPYTTYGDALWPTTTLLNAYRYRPEEVEWPEPLPLPLPPAPPYARLFGEV